MNKTRIWSTMLLTMVFLPHSTSAMDLTAVTLFGCDDRGTVDPAFRNNSGPLDAAWDVFLYEGHVFDPASDDPDKIQWLNDRENHTVKIPLTPGTHTFTFHCESARRWPFVGMNLFFDGVNDEAAISVKAPMDTHGPPYPAFTPKQRPEDHGLADHRDPRCRLACVTAARTAASGISWTPPRA